MEKSMERNSTLSWSAYVGCMFIGMGIGALYDQEGVGTIIGLGVGFVVSALIEKSKGASGEE